MNDKERLICINEELNAIVTELKPKLNELFFINDCLEDLIKISNYENQKYNY